MWLFNYCSAITSSIPTEIFRYFIKNTHLSNVLVKNTYPSNVWGAYSSQNPKFFLKVLHLSGHQICAWAQTFTLLPRHDCDHTIITCQGSNVSGHKHAWVQTCLGTNESGHKPVWAQTCLGTNVCWHKYVWGHKSVWAQSCVGTNVSGHNRVGSSMHGHKRVVSVFLTIIILKYYV